MKKFCFLLICASFCFIGIFADSKSDKEAKLIKLNLNKIKNKMQKTEATKKMMAELQEDIKLTDVLDENTVKDFEEANQLMESVSEIIKSANVSLLTAELNEGDLRSTEIKKAQTQNDLANEKLYKIQLLLVKIADRSQLVEKITEIVSSLKSVNQNVVAQIGKELAGEKKNSEDLFELTGKQLIITKSILRLEYALNSFINKNENQDEKKLLLKVSALLLEEKVTSKSKELEGSIENDDLIVADLGQKELIKTMLNALTILSPVNELTKEKNIENDPSAILRKLLTDINSQNAKIIGVIEAGTGNPNIAKDPHYDPLLGTQNGLRNDAKKDFSELPLDPETKKKLGQAIEAINDGRKHLENGEPQKAVDANNNAATIISKAIETMNNKSTAENKNNDEKGNQIGKDDKPSKDNSTDKNKNPEIADVNLAPFDEDQKAARFAFDFDQVKIRKNIVKLGDAPQEKEVWLTKSNDKNKAILLQSLVDSAPKEYAEPTKKYFEVISTIGE